MKLTKQELKQRISDSITDNDELVISLLEDIEDSMSEAGTDEVISQTLKNENEELKFKYEDLQRRYKERFLTGVETNEEKVEEETPEEIEEKNIIDIKEI